LLVPLLIKSVVVVIPVTLAGWLLGAPAHGIVLVGDGMGGGSHLGELVEAVALIAFAIVANQVAVIMVGDIT